MVYEAKINIGNESYNAILQDGFFIRNKITYSPHRHRYGEIHIIAGGKVTYEVDLKNYELNSGDAIFIPPHVFHHCVDAEENVLTYAFQVDELILNEIKITFFDETIINLLEKATMDFKEKGEEDKLLIYLSLIISGFKEKSREISITPVQNREFLIYEFFANRYSDDITLKDVANELHLSEKQASRMIEKYTGNNFRTEILKRKMEAARYMIKAENMSLDEIAKAVGYSSYGGFWKAFTSHNKEE